jgi:large subunit ribosomal protein L1
MPRLSKRTKAMRAKVETNKSYAVHDALALIKQTATAKFDESVDVAVVLGVDAKKSDQAVRGSVVLPEGTGKSVRVAVFAQGAKVDEARAAGADVVGFEDLAAKVKEGFMDFDVVIAAPDAMASRVDAEPQGRHGHRRRGGRREECQGRPGAVPD